MTVGEPARRTTTVDSYEIAHIRRECHLSGVATLVLITMTIQVDWRDPQFKWQGTLSVLHDDTGHTREAIGKAMVELETKQLIAILSPFRSGREGLVEILAYERLVRLSKRQCEARASAPFDVVSNPTSRENEQSPGPDIAGASRGHRGEFAATSTGLPRTPCPDSDKVGRGLQGEKGEDAEPLLTDEKCDYPGCLQPLHGHTETPDHEPRQPSDGWWPESRVP
jgi:hypothetical protein